MLYLSRLFFKIENQYESEEEKSPNGIGLENLKNRLELIYPKNHVLQIKKINEIYSVTLEIQLH